ncbi:hypothetical protein OH491_16760 [Termitidicoccus mucosus]|uniref:Autotransporter domain-containing protein n=1 Tax=Termitidicoccus mucosus TaxID=1184151 RepID=A0A178IIJ3_9BACT|nr:hypothetical protein AW736_11830 [Opitutaceae bacterium TSB47]
MSRSSTLTGNGSINASGTGLALGSGASFTVGSSNEYKGGKVGISLENTATLTNSGTIIGTDVTGVETKSGSVLVTNNAGGLIQGGSSAVSLAAGGTVINSGTMTGTSVLGVGIYSNGSARISNEAGALIQGNHSGVAFAVGGTVSNSGTIKGTDGYGVLVNAGLASVTNNAGGLIQGPWAVFLLGGGTVTNSGTILGINYDGVRMEASGLVINSGLIETSGDNAVELVSGGTVSNAGRIQSTLGRSIYTSNAATVISNTTTGLIQSDSVSVHLASGGTLYNSGTIIGTGTSTSRGIYSGDAATFISNTTTGLIVGATSGVHLASGGTLYNSGTIRSSMNTVWIQGTPGLVVNSGFIESLKDAAMQIESGGTVKNTGTIQGNLGISVKNTGLYIENAGGALITTATHATLQLDASSTVFNAGRIESGFTAGILALNQAVITNTTTGLIQGGSTGVHFSSGGTLVNSGTILGSTSKAGSVGVRSNGLTTITNRGYIEGHSQGVYFNAGAAGSTLVNSGTIRALMGSIGVVSETSVLVSNTAGGLIEGSDIAVSLLNGGTVANSGRIIGGTTGVQLGNGGVITNSGTITGTTGYGVRVIEGLASITNNVGGLINGGIYAGGTTTVLNNGLLTGTLGIYLSKGSTLAGSGSINASGTALALGNGVSFTVGSSNEYKGGKVGSSFENTGTLTNSGKIIGTDNFGVEAKTGSVLVTNNAAALIQGGTYGVSLAYGGTVINSGTIIGTGVESYGIHSATTAAVITNAGLIHGSHDGIKIMSGGVVNNTGRIIGLNASGVYANDVALITNTGGLISGSSVGVYLYAGGTLSNTGTVSGKGDYGVRTGIGVGKIINSADGVIDGGIYAYGITSVTNDGRVIGARGIELGASSTLTGTGSVDVTGTALKLASGLKHTNAPGALLRGGQAGVSFVGAGTLTNSGTIIGTNGTGVEAKIGSVLVSNTSTGFIQGGTYGVYLAVSSTVTNAGRITGSTTAVQLYQGGEIINGIGGLIQSDTTGIWISGGTVRNSGTISGMQGYGIHSLGNFALINSVEGVIRSVGGYGMNLGAGGTVTNAGTITSAGNNAIFAPVSAFVSNTTTGLIQGGYAGVGLSMGGTIKNSGTISGANDYAVYVEGGMAEVDNNEDGVIEGGIYAGGTTTVINDGRVIGARGILLGASSSLTGTGSIDVAGSALTLASGLSHTNVSGVFLRGGQAGVSFAGAGTLTNSGTVIGTTNTGVQANTGSVLVANTTTGQIQGGHAGVMIAAGGTVSNSGTIIGTNGYGISATNAVASVSNTTGALIKGSTYGVSLASGGTVLNSGTILGSTSNAGSIGVLTNALSAITNSGYIEGYSRGVYFNAGAAGSTLVNSGIIRAIMGSDGVVSEASVLVSNTAGGLINGSDIGVRLQGGGTVSNAGSITGGTTGIQLGQGGVIANTGTIIGTNGYGVSATNAIAYVSNTTGALIRGGTVGVSLASGGTVLNSGTIQGSTGNAGSIGVLTNALSAITNSGHINGSDVAVRLQGGGTVSNAGFITGGTTGIQFGQGGVIANTGTIIGTNGYGISATNAVTYVSNTTGALIEGGTVGVSLASGGTVLNSGTILGSTSKAGSVGVHSNGLATIANRGYIEGYSRGVYFNAGAAGSTLVNSGTIRALMGSDGVVSEANVLVSNTAGGLINGSDIAVRLQGGGTVSNAGFITGGTTGIQLGQGGVIANIGTIIGTNGYGISATNAVTYVSNTTGALIKGGQAGVYLTSGGTVTNAGTITGIGTDGIRMDRTGLVVNSGLVEGSGDDAVQLSYGGTVQNTGTLRGEYGVYASDGSILIKNDVGALVTATYNAILLSAGGTVVNAGIIQSADDMAFNASGGAVVVTNTTGGVIRGPGYAVWIGSNSANEVNLWNSSTLAGNLLVAGTASRFTLNGDFSGTQRYANAVTGSTEFSGTLIKTGTGVWAIDSNPGAGMKQAATLVQAGTLQVEWAGHQLNNAAVNIAAAATLQVSASVGTGTTTLVNPLTGAGLLDLIGTAGASNPKVTFALAPAMGSAFTGTVAVRGVSQTTVFDLATSETALTNALLKLNTNSKTSLDANRTVGGLDLAGGTLLTKSNTSAADLAPYVLTTGTLMSTGNGSTIGVDTDVLSGITLPLPPVAGLNANVFDVDVTPLDTLHSGTIVHSATSTIANGVTYAMVDSSGSALPSGTSTISFGQNGLDPVGVNTYGYNALHQRNTDGSGNIVLNYGLISIASIHATEQIILDPTGSLDKTLGAKLTGTGAGFTFTGTETITLAHSGNNYTGSTLVRSSAWIKAAVNNVIASSTKVTLADVGTGFDLGGYDQTLQNLSGAGSIRLGGKTLTVANTGTGLTLSGAITDNGLSGGIVLTAGSEWTLTGKNTYTGQTAIGSGAKLQLGTGGTSGMIADASAVANSGTLVINRSDDLIYGGAVTGSGVLVQRGTGKTTLTGANQIGGGLFIENGTLEIGQNDSRGWQSETIAPNVRVDATAALIFNRSGMVTYTGVISGAGEVRTIGSGVLALTRAQTYTGDTRVTGGTLRLAIANAIQSSAKVHLTNGTLDLNSNPQRIQNLVSDNGVVRYSTASGTATAYTTLMINGNLEGTSTHLMNVDLVGSLSDKLMVLGQVSGTHFVHFTPTTDPTLLNDPQRTYSLAVGKLGDGSTAVVESDGIESGMRTYQLYKGDGGLILTDENNYYLSGGSALSRAADAILLTAGVMGTDWHYSLDNVHKRIGEIRGSFDDSGAVWVRMNNYRLNAGAGLGGSSFEQDSFGLTAGCDKEVFTDGKNQIIAGGYLGINQSARTFDEYGDGSTGTLGLGFYGLWLYDNSWFADATLSFGRMSNDLNARGVDGHVSRGTYSQRTQSISIEVGRRFAKGIYWVEPSMQAALAWINGTQYTVSNGVVRDMRVDVGNSEAWQYRWQLRIGAVYGNWQPYMKLGSVKSDTRGGEVTAEDRTYEPWFDGWRFETGAGVNYLIEGRGQLYLDYEYNHATRYERPWSLTLGYRHFW